MSHWNRLFWACFILIGLVMIFGNLLQIAYSEILFGLFVIILGIQKLAEENRSVDLETAQEKMGRSMDQVTHWMNSTYDYVNNMRARHEYRLYHLDKKRSQLEDKSENNYRELAKKLFDLENRMNELARAGIIAHRPEIRSGRGTDPKINLSVIARNVPLKSPVSQETRTVPAQQVAIKITEPAKPRELKPEEKLADLSERQIGAIKVIRSKGNITTRDYISLFKVSDRTAQNDLKSLVSKNLVKRVGEGARTHYAMAF